MLSNLGPSVLLVLPYFDLIRDTVVDSMHACWDGVVKRFLLLWMSSKNKDAPFYVTKKSLFEERLAAIKLPHDFSHRVRSYKKEGAYWKGMCCLICCSLNSSATEFKNFALIVFPSIMEEFLTPRYFSHFMLFVRAMATLSSRSISRIQVQDAKQKLNEFVQNTEQLYGQVVSCLACLLL
jgi:hypothetical protein